MFMKIDSDLTVISSSIHFICYIMISITIFWFVGKLSQKRQPIIPHLIINTNNTFLLRIFNMKRFISPFSFVVNELQERLLNLIVSTTMRGQNQK